MLSVLVDPFTTIPSPTISPPTISHCLFIAPALQRAPESRRNHSSLQCPSLSSSFITHSPTYHCHPHSPTYHCRLHSPTYHCHPHSDSVRSAAWSASTWCTDATDTCSQPDGGTGARTAFVEKWGLQIRTKLGPVPTASYR